MDPPESRVWLFLFSLNLFCRQFSKKNAKIIFKSEKERPACNDGHLRPLQLHAWGVNRMMRQIVATGKIFPQRHIFPHIDPRGE